MILPVATLSLMSTLAVVPVPETTQPLQTSTSLVANVLPADTPLVGLVSTKSETWKTLTRFQLFKTVVTAASQFLPTGLNYERDVEPWLGEQIAFAFLPKVGTATTNLDDQFLMLAPVKDNTRLQPLLEILKADTQRVKVREYKGISILELQTPAITPPSINLPPSLPPLKAIDQPELVKPNENKKQSGIAIASFPGYIITSLSTQSIERLIDASQGSATLAQNPQFQRTLQRSQSDNVLFTLYENIPSFIPLISDIAKDPSLPFPLPIDTANLEQLNEYSTIEGFLTVQPEGLRFQARSYRQKLKPENSQLSTNNQETIITRMPGATYSAITGYNFNQQWLQLTQAFSSQPQLKELLTTFRNFVNSTTGLDIEKDITSWMDKEYGFFLFPTKGGFLNAFIPNFNLGIGVAVQTSNRTAAENTLNKLEKLLESSAQGGVLVKNYNIKGQPVTSWDVGGNKSQSLLAYSWVDNDTLILTTGFGAIADLVPRPYITLPATYNFTTATSSLPRPNQGYFYTNTGSFLSWVYGFLPTVFNNQQFQTWKPLLGSIYSISGTSYATPDTEQFDILLVLAPTRE